MDKRDKPKAPPRKPYIWEIILAMVILIGVLVYSVAVLGIDVHIPFIVVAALTALTAIRMGYTWQELENSILKSIASVMQAVLILIMVGMVIGSWIQGGIVPSLVYYGLQMIHPQVFLVAIFLVGSLCSIATGSSWTMIGTLGVAAIGISEGMGIPLPLTAGIVIGAGYFGDKLSPLSDTPNLHCAIARVNLFEHCKNVFKYTIPSFLLALLMCFICSRIYAPRSTGGMSSIAEITETLHDSFVIHPLLILPVLMVFLMIALKIPAIPGILLMAVVGSLCAMIVQGANLHDTLTVLLYGYSGDTGSEIVDSLVTRGGMDSMMYITSLNLCVSAYGGVIDVTRILHVLVEKLLGRVNSPSGIMISTALCGFILNIIAVDNYVSAVMTGNMLREKFIRRGLSPLNLSRCLAESCAITSPLIPWNTCGITMLGMLGIPVLKYAPFAFLLYIPPIMVIVISLLKKGIIYLTPEEQAELLKNDSAA